MKNGIILFMVMFILCGSVHGGTQAEKKPHKVRHKKKPAKKFTTSLTPLPNVQMMVDGRMMIDGRIYGTPVDSTVSAFMERPSYTRGDSICAIISGTIQNDGSCGVGSPVFAIEMKSGSGWVELYPFQGRMFCGYPHLHLRNSRTFLFKNGREYKLGPGEYKIIFPDRNNLRVATPAFKVEE